MIIADLHVTKSWGEKGASMRSGVNKTGAPFYA